MACAVSGPGLPFEARPFGSRREADSRNPSRSRHAPANDRQRRNHIERSSVSEGHRRGDGWTVTTHQAHPPGETWWS